MHTIQNTCINCNNSFVPKSVFHPHQKFCTTKCRVQVQNKARAIQKACWMRANKERVSQSRHKYLENHPEKRKQSSAEYQQKNKVYYNQYSTLRTRYAKQARPKWLNEFEELWLDEIYSLAQKTGLEVDHIIPIKNNKVCGLHVPWNLQLLTREANARKSNKFDEDVIAVLTKEPVDG